MIPGFNHNVKHRGKLFHIQTEDSGRDNPHIITHLFVGGNIIATKKTSYADIIKVDRLEEVVRELMQEQHKAMLRNLIGGQYDGIAGTAGAAEAPTVKEERHRITNVNEVKKPGGIFGGGDEDSEKSLDEIILSYLADDTGSKS